MKTICIYHRIDLDGWMSAAIVKHWYLKNEPEPKMTGVNLEDYPDRDNTGESSDKWNVLDFLGWNYGDTIPDLSEYDKVIMCDISFPKEEMLKLWETKGLNFYWIDHHISAIKEMENAHENISSGAYPIQGFRDVDFAACELTWIYFMEGIQYNPGENYSDYDMPEIVRLLGMYDSFRHKGQNEEQKVLEFQYGARSYIKNYQDAYEWLINTLNNSWGYCNNERDNYLMDIYRSGQAIYQYLCTEAKQVYKNGFEIILEEDNWFDTDTIIGRMTDGSWENRKFICFNKERFNPINFGIEYHKDGYDGAACFSYDGEQWLFSLYNDNGEVDCSQIAKQHGGGGHRGAAGFVVKDVFDIIG